MTCLPRSLRLPLFVLTAALLIAGCSAPPTPDSSEGGGSIVIGSISDIDSWNEYLSAQDLTVKLLRRIYLRLAQEQGDAGRHPQTFAPLLAESWESSDDGRTLTFRLREARWSDGRPISADDVRFTWQAQTSPDVPWVGKSAKSLIRDVEVIDERTVAFHFSARYPHQLADAVDGGILPRHVFAEVPFEDWATHDWSRVRIASGPFVLDEYLPDQRAVLVRNPHYFEPDHPRVERVTLRVVPDIASLLLQLRSGEVDYVEGIPPREAEHLASLDDVAIMPFDYPTFDYIGWNGSRPPFHDLEVRRAMTLAIDREALVDELLYGHGRVSYSPMPSFRWDANDSLAPWPYEPDEARRILSDRGFATLGEDGQTWSSGKRLELEMLVQTGNQLRQDMAIKIQQHLARVGVKVRVRPLEMRALRGQAAAGEYDAYLGGWVFSGRVDLKALFGSDFAPPNGVNVISYHSNEVDTWLDNLDAAGEWQELKPTLDRIQLRLHEDQPYTFLYESRRIAAHRRRLKGVSIGASSDSLAHLESLWVAAP